MKRVLWGIEAILILVFAILLTNHLSNEWMIKQYSQNVYQENNLAFLGFWQPYVSAYNLGNVYYKRGEYENAITKYREALNYHPTQKYDCKIRINEVFAMLGTFDEEKVTVDNYDESIKLLEDCKEILCKKGCADKDSDKGGHNKDAQQLKNDIEECIKRLGVKVSLIKNNEKNAPLLGATLQVLDKDGKVMYEWVSTEDPYTQIRFVKGESYTYHEVQAPQGYSITEDIVFVVNEDGTVSYTSKDGTFENKHEVIMIDLKQEQSSSSSSGQQDPDDSSGSGSQDDGQSDADKQLEEALKELQEQAQSDRVGEMKDDEYDYQYYDGPSW